ncbi:MAG: type III toxin-antitoxin system ToxN/AbiQ family toxin [Clostridiales bacterium]|nr:type III toxin-antitoxin system ToxN/AbiQ family toxin [Clostridiales bacterium]
MKFYEVDSRYVDYLLPFVPHLFRNKQQGQQNERKYIGVVLKIDSMEYFAPLSSYKPKHEKMKEGLDFVKVGNYAVININNMFPVPEGCYSYVDFNRERDWKYKKLLMAEYRIILRIQDKIRKNAAELYKQKILYENKTALTKRCNDFLLLEEKCKKYIQEYL